MEKRQAKLYILFNEDYLDKNIVVCDSCDCLQIYLNDNHEYLSQHIPKILLKCDSKLLKYLRDKYPSITYTKDINRSLLIGPIVNLPIEMTKLKILYK